MASIEIKPGTRVVVMGLGRFGGGVGVTRWLLDQGARVVLNDRAEADALADSIATLRAHPRADQLSFDLGHHDASVLDDADVLVVNPAVAQPWGHPLIKAAQARGLRMTTEIELLLRRLPRGVTTAVITGTVGKSTTAAMIHHALRAHHGRVWLGGNIGGTLLRDADSIQPDDIVVLELSSAMLHWLRDASCFAPRVGVLTNFSPNHVDWHGSLDHYRNSKQLVLDALPEGADAVLGCTVADWSTPLGVGRHVIERDAGVEGLLLPGGHNAWNAAVACRVAELLGTPPAAAAGSLQSFAGLPHRLCLIRDRDGVRWYDDSKSSTPAAAATAISAIAPTTTGRIHLILGGYDKKAGFDALRGALPSSAAIYAIGATMPEIERTFEAVIPAGTLDRAVESIARAIAPGDTVLLSPACASWDQFTSFEERGRKFAELAEAMA